MPRIPVKPKDALSFLVNSLEFLPWLCLVLVPAHPALVSAIVLGPALGGRQHPNGQGSPSLPGHALQRHREMPVSPCLRGTRAPGERAVAQALLYSQLCIVLAEGVPWELWV